MLTRFIAIFLICFVATINSWSSCRFPQVYIHHKTYPVTTDIDGGPSTWFHPLIKGAYLGCGLGISDDHHFTLGVGETHTVGEFKYYAVVGISKKVCSSTDVYGEDSPIRRRYESICNSSQNTERKAPGICLVRENRAISWMVRDCVNKNKFKDVLSSIDQAYPNLNAIPDIDECLKSAGYLMDCFPFPLPPSPPPFCTGNLPSIPQSPVVHPICNKDASNADICGAPTSTSYSTHDIPCARVTFDNPIGISSPQNVTNRLIPKCGPGVSSPCVDFSSSLSSAALTDLDQAAETTVAGYSEFESIYTQTMNNTGIPITSKTRWNPHIERDHMSFFGYNLAEYQDICYNYSSNTFGHVTMTDNHGTVRNFRTCKDPDADSSYCIEESSDSASAICQSTQRYCFSRPNIDKPVVEFCDNKQNTKGQYCMKVTSGGQTYIFNEQQKTHASFRAMETNNNYNIISSSASSSSPGTGDSAPTVSNICEAYYDKSNAQYSASGNSPCQYYGGLYYNKNKYVSGANKFCLAGYEPKAPQDMVCTSSSSSSQTISTRTIPSPSTSSPLNEQCCDPNPSPMSFGCTRSAESPLRAKNPIELGLCVDIMPYTFEDCSRLSADSTEVDPSVNGQETQALTGRCRSYQASCSKVNSTNNGYVNADSCNKDYIDCAAGRATSSGNSEICKFFKIK
jgi:hypothetical protein